MASIQTWPVIEDHITGGVKTPHLGMSPFQVVGGSVRPVS